MKRSTAKLLMVLNFVFLFVAGLIVTFVTNGNKTAMYILVAVSMIIALILGRYLRCPKCGRHQAGKGTWFWAEYCPYCGASLEDE